MDGTQNKLIADLHIGYSKLRDEIKEVNTLLGALGKNVTIDFSEIVKKQVKNSISELVKEAKSLGETTQSQNEKTGKSFDYVATRIKTVQTTIRETDAEGKLLAKTFKGIGENGEKVSEIFRFKSDGSTDFKRRSEEISKAIQLEKDYASSMVSYENAKAKLAKATPETNEWHV